MAAAASASSGPRYAPEDPTLPKPWKGLVDGNTGYLYFWNPETNVTQYERPVAVPPPLPSGHPAAPKLAPIPLSSSVQSQQGSGHGQQNSGSSYHSHHAGSRHSMGSNKNDEGRRGGMAGHESRYNGSSDRGAMAGQQPKLAAIPAARNQQSTRSNQQNAPTDSNGSIVGGHGQSNLHNHGSNSQTFLSNQSLRSSSRMHSSSGMGGASSAEAYRRQHEISVTVGDAFVIIWDHEDNHCNYGTTYSYARSHVNIWMGDGVPSPFMTFESTGFSSEILREVHHAGFSVPTPIQAQTWPIALQNRDIVAIAKTGSGKTLGYLIPAFIHLKRRRNNSQMGPSVLVLSPTRELATQIQDEAVKFGKSSRISCTCVYGGAPKGPQLREIDRGVDMVVATPGRLNDILEMKRISLRQVSYLVLDEADRMLDMGFEPQIRKIVNEIPPRRQTLMYTATWPKEVRKIAGDLLVNPVQVNIGSVDELAANKAITQYVEVVKPMEKQRRLEQILRSQEPGSKVLIFCSTKKMCDQLTKSISRQFGAVAIHGDKSQAERDWVLNQFRLGRSPILVATDVAARGLDIKDIRVVVNYDFPTGIEDYVHRIGRTGRAGATGVSYTFFSDQDCKYASDLVKVLEGASQRVPPEIRDMAMRSAGMSKGRGRWDYGSRRANRETSRNYNAGRNDAGGRSGRGPPSSGRSDRGYGGYGGRSGGHNEREPRDRYRDGHDLDTRGRHDRGLPVRAGEKDRVRSRSRSRSRSYSPSRSRQNGWGYCRSKSRSHSLSKGRSCSRSRSRSRSFNRYGGGLPAWGQSPPMRGKLAPMRRIGTGTPPPVGPLSPPPQHQRSPYLSLRHDDVPRDHSRSPLPHQRVLDEGCSPEQPQWRLSPYQEDMEGATGRAASPLPTQLSPLLPYCDEDSGEEGMIPADDGVGSPALAVQGAELIN